MGNCICPKCKSSDVIPIMYGYPSQEAVEMAEQGKLKLGGCTVYGISGDMADRFCRKCQHEWCIGDFLAEDIVKVRFRYWSNWGFFDPESMIEEQWAFDVFSDGRIRYSSYPRASRRVLDSAKVSVPREQVRDFFQKVVQILNRPVDIIECKVCDGCSYEFCITYPDNRKKKLYGDLGGGTVDKTVMDFLLSIPEIKEKIEEDNEDD